MTLQQPQVDLLWVSHGHPIESLNRAREYLLRRYYCHAVAYFANATRVKVKDTGHWAPVDDALIRLLNVSAQIHQIRRQLQLHGQGSRSNPDLFKSAWPEKFRAWVREALDKRVESEILKFLPSEGFINPERRSSEVKE